MENYWFRIITRYVASPCHQELATENQRMSTVLYSVYHYETVVCMCIFIVTTVIVYYSFY